MKNVPIKILRYLNACEDEGDDTKEQKDRPFISKGAGELRGPLFIFITFREGH